MVSALTTSTVIADRVEDVAGGRVSVVIHVTDAAASQVGVPSGRA